MGIEDRTRRERETLIFQSPEGAEDFTRDIENRIQQEKKHGVVRQREIVGQKLAEQFDGMGHGVSLLSRPWEHTQAEHVEVQKLVDVAFAHDLATAISQAEKSPFFPRNIDLFHDLLTGEMHEAISRTRVPVRHIPLWIILSIPAVFILLLAAILLFVYSL